MTPPLALGGGPGRLPGPGAKKAGEKEGTNCEAAGGANVRASASLGGFTALLACGSSPSSCGSSVVWAALTQAHHSLPPSPRRSVRFQSDPWVGSARPLHGFLQVLLWSRQLGWSTELPLPGVGADAPESLRGFESSLLSHTWTHHFKVQELFAASPLPPLPPSSWFCASNCTASCSSSTALCFLLPQGLCICCSCCLATPPPPLPLAKCPLLLLGFLLSAPPPTMPGIGQIPSCVFLRHQVFLLGRWTWGLSSPESREPGIRLDFAHCSIPGNLQRAWHKVDSQETFSQVQEAQKADVSCRRPLEAASAASAEALGLQGDTTGQRLWLGPEARPEPCPRLHGTCPLCLHLSLCTSRRGPHGSESRGSPAPGQR